MKPSKHPLFQALLLIITSFVHYSCAAQPKEAANAFSSFKLYDGLYHYGVNQGWYGTNWNSPQIGKLARDLGVRTLRIPLYDEFFATYGLHNLVPDFVYYADSLGAKDMVAFIGKPSAANRDTTVYPGSNERAISFLGLYEPVWLDKEKKTINIKNTYAKYLFDVVQLYGKYIKFWEIVNEPDFTHSAGGWLGDFDPSSSATWFKYNPKPEELVNLKAPITTYIRLLRVSWEVIKTLQPDDYICTGGIAYKSFLDALLRNTDNPVDGSVTSQYPLQGGAYFDVLSFHSYPMYYLKRWDQKLGKVVHFRHSDAAVEAFINIKAQMDSLLKLYGYDHTKFPRKQFICTETGLSRIMDGDNWGSSEGQLNFLLKAQVAAQKNNIKQLYWFHLGDMADPKAQFDQMGLYYYFGDQKPFNAKPTQQGIGLKTMTELLYEKKFDSLRTASMLLPTNVDGGAFKGKDGKYVYVLWAKTSTDLSEQAVATYSFPANIISTKSVAKKEWDYAEKRKEMVVSKVGVRLTETPSFFTEAK